MDQKGLERLKDWCIQRPKEAAPLTIFIAPYGEVLGLDYYWTFLGQLTALPQIAMVGVQTNLSFGQEGFDQFIRQGGDRSKLTLWATYHPQMVTRANFLAQVDWVSAQVQLSVGTVGVPEALEEIRDLKAGLPHVVYLWINALDPPKRPYTIAEIEEFTAIDPLFPLELKSYPCDLSVCDGGRKSLFVTYQGEAYLCNKQKKSLGNLYTKEPLTPPLETKGRCDCYLSYCHRQDLPALEALGQGLGLRVPIHPPIKTICFDLDGTLLDETGRLPESTIQAVAQLAKTCTIYLVTMRPMINALAKCGAIKPYLSGGVFASGAQIKDFTSGYGHTQPLSVTIEAQGAKVRHYQEQGQIYKTTILSGKQDDELYQTLQARYGQDCTTTQEGRVISLVHQLCSKEKGLFHLLEKLGQDPAQVLVVGNDQADCPMLQAFPQSVAVPTASPAAKEAAKLILTIPQLTLLV